MRGLLCVVLAAGGALAQRPAEKEKALGQALAADIERQARLLSDPEVAAYVNKLIEKLSPAPVSVSMIDSADAVASPLPGGILVLSSGAMLRTSSEAELAALLAHHIGHLQARLESVGDFRNPIVFLGGWSGLCARTGDGPIPTAYSARTEPYADAFALSRLAAAGYDLRSLPDVFKRWSGRYPPQEAAGSTRGEAVVTTSEFDRIRKRLAPPPAPRRPAPSLRRRG